MVELCAIIQCQCNYTKEFEYGHWRGQKKYACIVVSQRFVEEEEPYKYYNDTALLDEFDPNEEILPVIHELGTD